MACLLCASIIACTVAIIESAPDLDQCGVGAALVRQESPNQRATRKDGSAGAGSGLLQRSVQQRRAAHIARRAVCRDLCSSDIVSHAAIEVKTFRFSEKRRWVNRVCKSYAT